MRVLWGLLVAYLAATAVLIGVVVALEPFSFDAWNVAVDTGAQSPSVGRFFEYWQGQYAHANPRLGQAFTYLAYKIDWFAVVATPLAYLALTLAATVIGLGRWPNRMRDVALWAIVVGVGWIVIPQIGRNLFCRAYSANYLWCAAIQLSFVARVRLELAKPTGQWVEFALFGAIAGTCNEHTGPALVIGLVACAWWKRRESPRFAIAGAIGAAAGVAALLLAPGQAERYEGLAQRAGLLDRVVDRGVEGVGEIFVDYLAYAAPVIGLCAIAWLVGRRRPVIAVLGLVGGIVIVATLCASPKLGSRFYIVPIVLLLAGLVALLDDARDPIRIGDRGARSARQLVPFLVLSVVASFYAGVRTVPLFVRLADQSAVRMAALEASAPGDVVIVEPWEQLDESWWFIGDDFRDIKKRELVARYFALDRVSLRGEPRIALPALGLRMTPRYRLDGVVRIDRDFDLGTTRSSDLAGIHRAMERAVGRRHGLDRYELSVELVGRNLRVPRRSVVLARWRGGVFQRYAADVVRGEQRRVVIPAELGGFEIFVVQTGETRKLSPPYEYALDGMAWILACDPSECLVIAAGR